MGNERENLPREIRNALDIWEIVHATKKHDHRRITIRLVVERKIVRVYPICENGTRDTYPDPGKFLQFSLANHGAAVEFLTDPTLEIAQLVCFESVTPGKWNCLIPGILCPLC